MSRRQPEIVNIANLFGSDQYVIPIYQRAYAWGYDQIVTLMQDVRDYRQRGATSYYIGSLVTHARALQRQLELGAGVSLAATEGGLSPERSHAVGVGQVHGTGSAGHARAHKVA